MEITLYDIKVFLWDIITFGFLPHILFVCGVLFLFFTLFFLASHHKIIRFTFMEKLFFFKVFMYHFLREKYYFLKYYVDIMLDYYNRGKVLVIVGTALTIIIITVYIIFRFSKG